MKLLAALILGAFTLLVLVGMSRRPVPLLTPYPPEGDDGVDPADPRLAGLTEALRANWPVYDPTSPNGYRGGPFDMDADDLAATLLETMR